MRYRVVIEVDADENTKFSDRSEFNELAKDMADIANTRFSNIVFLSTEIVEDFTTSQGSIVKLSREVQNLRSM